jgi:hypothetical protein
MSEITAAIIRTTLGQFDAFVRVAVENGNLDKISAKEGEIVSNIFIAFIATQRFLIFQKKFYKICMRFTDPERVAAFNATLFLHNFFRDYRKDKTSPTFLHDQRQRLKKFDKKNLAASWASLSDPVIAAVPPQAVASMGNTLDSGGPAPALPSNAPPTVSTKISPVNHPIAAATTVNTDISALAPAHFQRSKDSSALGPSNTKIPAATNINADNIRTAAALGPSTTKSPAATNINANHNHIVSGPGPSSLATRAAAKLNSVQHQAQITTADFHLLHQIDEEDETWKKFNEIEQDEDMEDVEILPRPQIRIRDPKGNDPKGKRKAVDRTFKEIDEDEDMEDVEILPRPQIRIRDPQGNDPKGKKKAVDSSDDEFKVIRSRPRKSMDHAPSKAIDYSTCSKCQISGKRCERQPSGGACVSCRRFKHKCEFARPRKQAKSKLTVESEDESTSKFQVESEDELSSTPEGRHPRIAAKMARRAIKKVVAQSPKVPKPRAKRNRTKSKFYYLPVTDFNICIER